MADDGAVPDRTDAITQLIQLGRDREAVALASERVPRGEPMDPINQLDQVMPMLTGLVSGLRDDDLAAKTPCSKFAVRDVLEHMIGGATMFAAAFRGEEPPSAPMPADVVTAFPVAMADLGDAIKAPGALDRVVAAPFGEVPGEVFARFVAMDGLVHGWDIATATGQPYDPPADLVAEIDAFARQAIADGMRDGDTFAAAVDAPAGCSPIERLAAFTGRRIA